MVYTNPLLSRVPEWGPAFICLQLFTTPNTHAQIDWLQVFFFHASLGSASNSPVALKLRKALPSFHAATPNHVT